MAGAFQYRPKFVDIRVKKPVAEPLRGKGERACDHGGCERVGEHRAPKARDRANEFWWFCREHAGEYNRRWNYFDGMSEDEFVNFQRAEETGHRPVWNFKPGRGERVSANRFWRAAAPGDSFGIFRSKDDQVTRPAPRVRQLSRLQVLALEALNLDETADAHAIRARYAEQVKRWHPDSNGGDRSAETMLQKAVHAYQTLKKAGLA